MRYFQLLIFLGLLAGFGLKASAQQDEQTEETPAATPTPTTAKQPPAGKQVDKAKEERDKEDDKPPVVTHHEIRVHGSSMKYTATTGMIPISDEDGNTEAHIFFIAYTLDNPPSTSVRPLTFCFNGGPGSSSVWLHMGAIGPRKVRLKPDGDMPHPPFELEDNQDSWLDQTDLVFIDPVGTGYSRPTKKELGKKFWGVRGDVASVGQFIRLYLSRNERWMSPLFPAARVVP